MDNSSLVNSLALSIVRFTRAAGNKASFDANGLLLFLLLFLSASDNYSVPRSLSSSLGLVGATSSRFLSLKVSVSSARDDDTEVDNVAVVVAAVFT